MVLWIGGIVLGLVSIGGGIAAATTPGGQPERYLVSAAVMICSGVLWLICSFSLKFKLTCRQYVLIVWMLGLGLILGLFNTYFGCGNECNCHRQFGYPGYWLQISNCKAGVPGYPWWRVIAWGWRINFASLVADVVFWSGAGLMISLVAKKIR